MELPLAKDFENNKWTRRYFAKYENGQVYAWGSGVTSWSACGSYDVTPWKYAKLAEESEQR